MHRALSSTTSTAAKHKSKRQPLGFYEKALPPPNPRYAHVPSRIDSGPTVAKLRTVTTRQFVRRRNEAFARVTPWQLGALAAEYGEGGEWGAARGCGTILEEEEQEEGHDAPPCCSGRSVIVTHDPTREAPLYEKPYLLLDVRPEGEAFERARLVDGACVWSWGGLCLGADGRVCVTLDHTLQRGTCPRSCCARTASRPSSCAS